MREAKANLALNELLKTVQKGFEAEGVVDQLKSLRELALSEEDPTVVKICRLATEYITEKGNFDLGYVAEEEIGEMSDMEYLIELMLHIDNQANREEIREIRDRLKAELY